MISALLKTGKTPNAIGAFEIDVTVSEVHNRSASVTSNPVESGASISDHVINDPKTVTLSGVVSNTPLALFGIGSDESRSQSAFDALEELYDSREPFDLQTGFKLYQNCVFTNLTMPKTRAGELRFTASFRQVTVVDTELALIPIDAVSAADVQFSSERDAGRQTATTADESKSASVLKSLADGIGSFF